MAYFNVPFSPGLSEGNAKTLINLINQIVISFEMQIESKPQKKTVKLTRLTISQIDICLRCGIV